MSTFFALRFILSTSVKVLRYRLGLRRCKRTERVSHRVGFWGPSRWSSAVRSLWAALACPIFVYLYTYIYIYSPFASKCQSVSKRVNPNLAPKPLVLCWGHASVWMCCYNSDVKRGSVSPSLFGMRFWADCFPRCPWPMLLLCLLDLFQLFGPIESVTSGQDLLIVRKVVKAGSRALRRQQADAAR